MAPGLPGEGEYDRLKWALAARAARRGKEPNKNETSSQLRTSGVGLREAVLGASVAGEGLLLLPWC